MMILVFKQTHGTMPGNAYEKTFPLNDESVVPACFIPHLFR
jgi:hypothetical protein